MDSSMHITVRYPLSPETSGSIAATAARSLLFDSSALSYSLFDGVACNVAFGQEIILEVQNLGEDFI